MHYHLVAVFQFFRQIGGYAKICLVWRVERIEHSCIRFWFIHFPGNIRGRVCRLRAYVYPVVFNRVSNQLEL